MLLRMPSRLCNCQYNVVIHAAHIYISKHTHLLHVFLLLTEAANLVMDLNPPLGTIPELLRGFAT
jgi:hypothetical protein